MKVSGTGGASSTQASKAGARPAAGGFSLAAAGPAQEAARATPVSSLAGVSSIGALLAAPVVAGLVCSTGGLLATRWPRYFGLRSYSLYRWHLPLISLAVHHAPEPVPHSLAVTLGLAASLLAAEASYRYVEMPVNSWRNRRLASARPAAGPLDSPVNEGSGARGGS